MSKVDDQTKKSMTKTRTNKGCLNMTRLNKARLNKKALARLIARRSGLKINQTELCIDTLIEVFGETIKAGGGIALQGMGTFQVYEYGERLAYNPSVGEHMVLPVQRRLKFIPSALLQL